MGLWLRLDGSSAVEWTRPAEDEGVVLRLSAGINIVGVVDSGAVDRLESATSVAWRWDAVRQRYAPHRFGDDALQLGDALRLEVSEPFQWWQPGSAEPPFVFHGDVPHETRANIIAAYRHAQRFFAERFAVVDEGRTWHIAADKQTFDTARLALFDEGPAGGGCGRGEWADGAGIELLELRCAYPFPQPWLENHFVGAMRYPDGVERRGAREPAWLILGQAHYLQASHQSDAGWVHYDRVRSGHIAAIADTSLPLRSFESEPWKLDVSRWAPDGIGFLAVEWLTAQAGDLALTEYFRLYWSSTDWRDAFETAFAMTLEDFYTAFETYRATLARVLPHEEDEIVGPVLAFRGGVPDSYAADTRSKFEAFKTFFEERFAAEPQELTVYVVLRSSEVEEEIPRWSGVLGGGSAECVNAWNDITVVSIDRCGGAIDGFYTGGVIVRSRDPWWLGTGLESYAIAVHQTHQGLIDFDAYREIRTGVAALASQPLSSLGTSRGELDMRSASALSFLAVEWLAANAGEHALVEYYQQHHPAPAYPPGSDPQSTREMAFEQAFGLTLEAFYEQFEAYRESLEAP